MQEAPYLLLVAQGHLAVLFVSALERAIQGVVETWPLTVAQASWEVPGRFQLRRHVVALQLPAAGYR